MNQSQVQLATTLGTLLVSVGASYGLKLTQDQAAALVTVAIAVAAPLAHRLAREDQPADPPPPPPEKPK